jgi:hypothetical protein
MRATARSWAIALAFIYTANLCLSIFDDDMTGLYLGAFGLSLALLLWMVR